METKVMKMEQAISRFVQDGDVIVIEGFTYLICFAAAHEIIRQHRRELTVCRLTPDLIYDQLIGEAVSKNWSLAGREIPAPARCMPCAEPSSRASPIL